MIQRKQGTVRRMICIFIMNLVSINITHAELHDPTEPLGPMVSTSSVESNYNLQSILIGPSRRLAMINGQIVGTGSRIQGARVLAIDKNHVVLFYAGRKNILYLFGGPLWKAH